MFTLGRTGVLLLRLPKSKGLYVLSTHWAHCLYAEKGVTFPPACEILNHPDVVFTFATFCSAK
jgi:hypothetical protein